MNIIKKNLRSFSYFRSGPVQVNYIRPVMIPELTNALKQYSINNKTYKIIGKTTNLIFKDKISVDVIIDMTGIDDIEVHNNGVKVQSGRLVSDLCRDALINGLSGLEGLEGIPGTIGGALAMNAGAYGYFISDYIKNVTVLAEDMSVKVMSKEECQFESRSSIFLNSKLIILSAEFNLIPGERELISYKMNRYHIARHKYQEWSYPNVGSNFILDDDIINIILKKESKAKQFLLLMIKIILYNKYMRRFFWVIPHKNHINKLVGKKLNADLTHFSIKNLNTIVNYDGNVELAIDNLKKMNCNLDNKYKVETEIVG
jgi:UDP-N-acetylmuramate dehydrogenase